MKFLIYGAGVLGSLYAARLQQAGHDVSILARGQRLADIRKHGLVLQDAATGQCTSTHVGVVETLEPEDAYDLAVVLVRKNQLASLLIPMSLLCASPARSSPLPGAGCRSRSAC